MRPIPQALRWVILLAFGLHLGVPIAKAQDTPKKKPLAVEDLYLIESVKSPTLFPKEEKLVYERVWIDPKAKEERHSLWIVDGKRDNRKPLEDGEPDGRSPVVSPDGQWIAFLSARKHAAGAKPVPPVPPYSDAAVDIWLYHVKSGQVMPLGGPDRPWGRVFHDGFYGRVAFFIGKGPMLVFVADDGADPRTKEEKENDVEIVRPDQGEGYTGYGPAQIWIAEVQTPVANAPGSPKITRLTNDGIWYGDPQWSPDGKSLVVVANKTKDRESVRFSINKNFDLFLIDVASKKQTQLTTNAGPDVSPRWSPDGKRIAYLSSPRLGPHRDVFTLSVLSMDGAGVTTRKVEPDHESKSEIKFLPVFPLPEACWRKNGSVWVRCDGINLVHWNRQVTPETGVEFPMDKAFEASQALASNLAPEANAFLENRRLASPEASSWKNEGFWINNVITLPPRAIAKPPYKLLVYPHGGPHSRSTTDFDFTVQLFAAHGYAVFQPNFRGSTGYGQKFLDADRFDLGGGDMRDILTGIDKLVKNGMIDPKRQFVYGISYGGFMTSWLVGHTHQFRAAVAQNAVTDMNMMWGLTDIQSWTQWELGGAPWQEPERYRKHSPLTYADKVKTPTLILHARDDRRCPLPMGKAFHQALLANDVPTQMVIYPNEGHGIRSPRHREDVYRRVLAWFAKHDAR